MKNKLCAAGVALLLGACATSPYLDSQFGQASRLIQAQQIINPQGLPGNPSAGVDGKVVKSGYDQYQKSFRAPEPQTQTISIGLGSSK